MYTRLFKRFKKNKKTMQFITAGHEILLLRFISAERVPSGSGSLLKFSWMHLIARENISKTLCSASVRDNELY